MRGAPIPERASEARGGNLGLASAGELKHVKLAGVDLGTAQRVGARRSHPGSLGRVGIAEAARLLGTTVRALRFYEEKELVAARRDSCGVRYYDAEARDRLVWICALRRAGLSLADIREVLDQGRSPSAARDLALARLRAKRDELVSRLAAIEQISGQLSGQGRPRATI